MDSVASPAPLDLAQRVDLDAVRRFVASVNRHFRRFLTDPAARKALQLECGRALAVSHQAFFEFSEHSVLSNLYWGVENIEVALRSRCREERAERLSACEKMLQMPALLEEEGSTAGVENRYLVCCSYFYLALARKLRGDEWQMIMHLLQSLLVSPSCFRKELAPRLWRSLFGSLKDTIGDEEEVEEMARQHARRYKDWLMYYQVVSYGETPPWTRECSDDDSGDREAEKYECTSCTSSARCFNSLNQAPSWLNFQSVNMMYPLNVKDMVEDKADASTSISDDQEHFKERKDENSALLNFDMSFSRGIKGNFDIRCLQEMLEESQSGSPVSFYSHIGSLEEESDSEMQERTRHPECPADILSMDVGDLPCKTGERNCLAQYSHSELVRALTLESSGYPADKEDYEANASCLSSRKSQSSLNNFDFSVLDMKEVENYPFCNYYVKDGASPVRSPRKDLRCFSTFSSRLRKRCNLSEFVYRGSFARRRKNFPTSEKDWSDESSNYVKDTQVDLLGILEKAASSIYFPDGRGNCEDADLDVTTIWELLKKQEVKHSSTKEQMLDQLLEIISASKKEKMIRESVSTLLLLISKDKTIIQDIKKKDSHLYYLASALKRNVHEAAILIYLLNPSPSEIRSLELLPALVEVACSPDGQNKESIVLPLTPSSASIAMIEILVTAFDYVTNNMHLAAISSPQILSKLVNVAMHKNLEVGVALAAILVRCMRLNGNCKKFLSQFTPVEPFLHLLRSNEKRSKFAALEYFHEILQIPRFSAIRLLNQIRQQRSIGIMHSLMACIQQTELEHQVMAANLLLQLDMLEGSSAKSVFKEEAMEVLLESIVNEKCSRTQTLSACILSNIGGTYSWAGEPYTTPWLLKRAGLVSTSNRNMIKNIDWLDPCLQDIEINAWSANAARSIIKMGSFVFDALAKGIQSKVKIVSHDCLVFLAWLGSEIAILGHSDVKYTACETLLNEIAEFLHPGSDLDERILSCICVYNYTSGKGKQKLMNFSEGIRESLRRLSSFTWMAEELLRVTDYFLPTKPRVSCVHTQILEVGKAGSGAATALLFFKGQLCVGHSDGSIRIWDIKGQKSMLLWEAEEHKRTVTCFTLSETGETFLSGSSDRTVRVWRMAQRKLECIEVIEMKEPIQILETYHDKILAITSSRGLKVSQASRSIQTLFKNKHIKCLVVAREKVYLGCADSSIQEVDLVDGNKTTIKAPASGWRMQKKPINSIKLYKDWVYNAGAVVEGSCMKDWRKRRQPQISLYMTRRTSVQSMEVVEDFIYLNCSSSRSAIQIWLRGQQQKVGRLSAGCKITSLLAANDIIFCGTESGLIKMKKMAPCATPACTCAVSLRHQDCAALAPLAMGSLTK
ncbi:E3 ubiquitin-protein ligase [Canna indica]|uniref:E3 ubiquitin-protein ligase n=1 Tax=Canna indica TaxID=4628 RepID=A0AAQ3KLV2_9LILI|nr:E3 ubiquitin-protein ligase [Canna indica]